MKNSIIPQNAPYNDAQRAWLGGFFAGIQKSSIPSDNSDARVIHILYGSQTGNSESVAHDLAGVVKAQGLLAVVNSMSDVELDHLIKMEYVLIVTSTYGEGDMPDAAGMLWNQLSADTAPSMEQTKFAVLALGDTSYDLFCHAGIEFDARLAELGAERLSERVDCDVDFDQLAEQWIGRIVPIVAEGTMKTSANAENEESTKPAYNRKNPFVTKITTNHLLTAEASSKETRHYEFSLEGSGLTYEAGDALNVVPQNCPELVASILNATGCDGDEEQSINDQTLSLSEVLRTCFEIKLPSKDLLQAIADQSADKDFNALLDSGDKDQLSAYLWGRDILDLLLQFPSVKFSSVELIALLKPLQHRAYSISSSGKMHPDSVHLTVASVRYHAQDRDHKGVCSTYMADLIDDQSDVKIFFSPNTSFRVPEDDSLPIIMVGPGTGIAPFRAFLQERAFRKASGKNWLLFGDRNEATDYIYRDEIEAMQTSGILHRLDLAFSRDQEEKIYVQDRMLEHGAEMFAWLEQGGSFYVCGDATCMAKDVDKALHTIIQQQGNRSEEQAVDYVAQLKKEKRYVRDVY